MAAFISIKIDRLDRLEALRHFVAELAKIKREPSTESAEKRLEQCLDEDSRRYFWTPSAAELDEWKQEWLSTPVKERLSNPSLHPHWEMSSFIEALINGEFLIQELQIVVDDARLIFEPLAYPYGGSSCLVAIVESFGQSVTGIDDGTGYRTYTKRESWKPKSNRKP